MGLGSTEHDDGRHCGVKTITIAPTTINGIVPAITGQMGHIVRTLVGRQSAAAPSASVQAH
jgi:hypothetical protein